LQVHVAHVVKRRLRPHTQRLKLCGVTQHVLQRKRTRHTRNLHAATKR
jgi:hypothetical protein